MIQANIIGETAQVLQPHSFKLNLTVRSDCNVGTVISKSNQTVDAPI